MASKEEILDVLRLINTPKIGTKKFFNLVEEHGSVKGALDFVLRNGLYKPWSAEQALREYENAQKIGVKILLYSDAQYPKALNKSSYMPPLLYARGNVGALNFEKSIAIVGGRSASITGRKTAAKIAKELAERDVCVVSGMARGIDAASHKGAMYAKEETGKTIAVLGTGVDVIYPQENADIYNQIIKDGCIISEYPLGTQAVASQFPQRNKIVAALSEAVLVVEAGINSGSLITAKLGYDMGKKLFAVPGTPGESRSQGANLLIKNGAILAESADDILPFLKGNNYVCEDKKEQPKQKLLVFENNDANYSEHKVETETMSNGLLDLISVDGVFVDELIRITGKDASTMAMEILELELDGKIEKLPGNRVALKTDC